MRIKEEMMRDLDLRIPRVLVHGGRGILDNVKTVELLSEESIVVSCGKQNVSIRGDGLSVTYLEGERMVFEGKIEAVEFYETRNLHG